MNNYTYTFLDNTFPAFAQAIASVIIVVVVWSLFWKGLALWHAGRKGQPWWFIILLLLNTLGILEIIYLFGVLKLKVSHLFKR